MIYDVSDKMAKMYPACSSCDQYKHKKDGMFIQEAMKHIKKGALTAQAKRHGESPMEFAKEVLMHPEAHTETTRKRAQFLMNIQKRHK